MDGEIELNFYTQQQDVPIRIIGNYNLIINTNDYEGVRNFYPYAIQKCIEEVSQQLKANFEDFLSRSGYNNTENNKQ